MNGRRMLSAELDPAVAWEQFFSSADLFPDRPLEAAFTADQWSACGQSGLLGASVAAQYGGGGLGALDSANLLYDYGRRGYDLGLGFAAGAHLFSCLMPIQAFGTPTLKDRLLPDLVSGNLVAANAITEPNAGSDSSRVECTAIEHGEEFLVSGQKSYVSNAPVAEVFVVFASTDKSLGFLGTVALVVERTDRCAITAFDKYGLAGCPGGEVIFDQCRVPKSNVLGEVGQGAMIFSHGMMWERTLLLSLFVGHVDRLIAQTIRWARERKQFGRPIADFQAVSHQLVDAHIKLRLARLAMNEACVGIDNDDLEATALASIAKVSVSEACVEGCMTAVRVLGGRAIRSESSYLRSLLDVLPGLFFSGTNEIQKEIIAREIGL
jgi:alkylation response protein AidB-like acyl-CoA dehydrogenase